MKVYDMNQLTWARNHIRTNIRNKYCARNKSHYNKWSINNCDFVEIDADLRRLKIMMNSNMQSMGLGRKQPLARFMSNSLCPLITTLCSKRMMPTTTVMPDNPTLIPWTIVIALPSTQSCRVRRQSQWQTPFTHTLARVSISLGDELIWYRESGK